jgi:hypothetical protein
MRTLTTAILSGLVLTMLVGSLIAQEDKGKVIKPEREWVEVINDEKLSKESPKDGIIVDAKAFEKLWKAWRKDEKVPKIDFDKNLVVITLSLGGPNKPGCTATLYKDGNLKIEAMSTLIGGDAFGYSIGVYPKAGIKKVNDKDVPKAKE